MSPSRQIAAPDSWFLHLALETNPKANKNTWLEQITDADYRNATEAKAVKSRTWVQRRLKPSTSASNSFPTFAVT